MLLKAFKSAVTVQDDQGKLPMHYACENRNIGKVALSLLYAAYPKAVEVEDGFGYTPITTAQAFGNNSD
jgi:ankyrin repeat protein